MPAGEGIPVRDGGLSVQLGQVCQGLDVAGVAPHRLEEGGPGTLPVTQPLQRRAEAERNQRVGRV
ncbi:hypothetical protein HDA36_001622 [Nocardiopsis composta]|uniref:Uncharacterized protein n=1 Tax=Nocardiopsis composta TaxID=157465 RepID=A0A7W8QKL8_9ACTN|nr:hypothetical protein [Nocardiopsis composta]